MRADTVALDRLGVTPVPLIFYLCPKGDAMKIFDPMPANLNAAAAAVYTDGMIGIEGTGTPATDFQRDVIKILKVQHPAISPVPTYVDYSDGVIHRGYLYVIYNENHPVFGEFEAVKQAVAAFDQANPI
jgi:hypothetical protein